MNAWTPEYHRWRHGGWYVTNLHYPSGAVGCVSRNYTDKQWRIVGRDGPGKPTYRTRDDAAHAERAIALAACHHPNLRPEDAYCQDCGERMYRYEDYTHSVDGKRLPRARIAA